MTSQCSNCKYYSEDTEQVRLFGNRLFSGVCRIAHPGTKPSLTNLSTSVEPTFPPCTQTTWCGEWVTV